MRVLNISIDMHLLDPSSDAAKRIVRYGDVVERYDVVVPTKRNVSVSLSDHVQVHPAVGKNKILQFFALYAATKRELKRGQYDIITAQDQFFTGLVGVFLARQFRMPIEVQVHGWERDTWIRNSIARFVLRRATTIRAVSRRLKDRIISLYNVPKERIWNLPVPSTISVATTIAKDHKQATTEDPFTFLTVGRLVPVKQVHLQIEAIQRLVKKGLHVRLVVVGAGVEQSRLEQLARTLKCGRFITLVPWVSQSKLVEYYKQADILLLTSQSEGWGRVVQEAAAFAVPTIMTDVGLAGEFLHHEKEGLVIQECTVQALVQEMKRFYADASLYETCSSNILNAIKTYPTMDERINDYVELWNQMI